MVAYRLGVDLGTTYTAAAVEDGGRAEAVQLGDDAPQIPSAVFVREDGQLLVGEAALDRGQRQPDRMESQFKRRLGDDTAYVLGGQEFTAQELTAELLRTVVDDVCARQGAAPERIALTHPANWGAHRRGLLLEAARLAGVGPVTTLTEPAAAAVHFSFTDRADIGDVVAVYDLGGGTFDAAVLRKTAEAFELMGTPDGVERLGGIDFDDKVFRHVLGVLDGAAAELDPDDAAVVAALVRLRGECTRAKQRLSKDSETTVPVALPGLPATSVRLSRAEFEDLIRPDVEQTMRCMHRALESASVTPEELRTIVLVGGSARIPLVSSALGHELGRPVVVSTQPKLAVALGAALLAGGARPDRSPARTDVPVPGPPGRTPRRPEERKVGAREPLRHGAHPSGAAAPRPQGVARLTAWITGLLVLAVLVAVVAPALLQDYGLGTEIAADRSTSGVVQVNVPAGADVEVGVLGVVLGSGTAPAEDPAEPNPDGRSTVDVDVDDAADLLPGPLRAVVSGDGGGTYLVPPAGGVGFVLRWAPVLLLLFAFGYAESLSRRIRRRGAAARPDVWGMAGVGAVLGLAVVLACWVLVDGLPEVPVVAVVLALTATAGSLLARLLAATAPRRNRAVPRP